MEIYIHRLAEKKMSADLFGEILFTKYLNIIYVLDFSYSLTKTKPKYGTFKARKLF